MLINPSAQGAPSAAASPPTQPHVAHVRHAQCTSVRARQAHSKQHAACSMGALGICPSCAALWPCGCSACAKRLMLWLQRPAGSCRGWMSMWRCTELHAHARAAYASWLVHRMQGPVRSQAPPRHVGDGWLGPMHGRPLRCMFRMLGMGWMWSLARGRAHAGIWHCTRACSTQGRPWRACGQPQQRGVST